MSLGCTQEGVILSVLCLICVLCYVIKTLGKKGLVTMKNRMTILGKDPTFGLYFLSRNPKFQL